MAIPILLAPQHDRWEGSGAKRHPASAKKILMKMRSTRVLNPRRGGADASGGHQGPVERAVSRPPVAAEQHIARCPGQIGKIYAGIWWVPWLESGAPGFLQAGTRTASRHGPRKSGHDAKRSTPFSAEGGADQALIPCGSAWGWSSSSVRA